MGNKHLNRYPHDLHGRNIAEGFQAWWYEDDYGIWVYISDPNDNKFARQCTIPWKSLRAALARKDKK